MYGHTVWQQPCRGRLRPLNVQTYVEAVRWGQQLDSHLQDILFYCGSTDIKKYSQIKLIFNKLLRREVDFKKYF